MYMKYDTKRCKVLHETLLSQTDSHDGVSTRAPDHHRDIDVSLVRQHAESSLHKHKHTGDIPYLQGGCRCRRHPALRPPGGPIALPRQRKVNIVFESALEMKGSLFNTSDFMTEISTSHNLSSLPCRQHAMFVHMK